MGFSMFHQSKVFLFLMSFLFSFKAFSLCEVPKEIDRILELSPKDVVVKILPHEELSKKEIDNLIKFHNRLVADNSCYYNSYNVVKLLAGHAVFYRDYRLLNLLISGEVKRGDGSFGEGFDSHLLPMIMDFSYPERMTPSELESISGILNYEYLLGEKFQARNTIIEYSDGEKIIYDKFIKMVMNNSISLACVIDEEFRQFSELMKQPIDRLAECKGLEIKTSDRYLQYLN